MDLDCLVTMCELATSDSGERKDLNAKTNLGHLSENNLRGFTYSEVDEIGFWLVRARPRVGGYVLRWWGRTHVAADAVDHVGRPNPRCDCSDVGFVGGSRCDLYFRKSDRQRRHQPSRQAQPTR